MNAASFWKQVGGVCVAGLTLGVAGMAHAQEYICFDAVTATRIEAPMTVAHATNAPAAVRASLVKGLANGVYLEIPQGKGNPPEVTTGAAVFTFVTEEAGDYQLWCRVWWSDECGNSFWISLNGAKPFVFGEDATFKDWHWVKAPARLKQLTLGKGPQTLTLANREDGAAIAQIFLTTDRRFVPVDEEPVTTRGGP